MTTASLCEARPAGPRLLWLWARMSLRRLRPVRSRRVLSEATDLLNGRSAETYAVRGQPIPYWAWVNAMAHRPLRDAGVLAAGCSDLRWSAAISAIAAEAERMGPSELEELRASVFIPAELSALSKGRGAPDELVRAVRRHVAMHRPDARSK